MEISRITISTNKRTITNFKIAKRAESCEEDRNKLENKQVGGLSLGLNDSYSNEIVGNKHKISQFFTKNIKPLYLRSLLKRVKYTCE